MRIKFFVEYFAYELEPNPTNKFQSIFEFLIYVLIFCEWY